MRNKSNNILTFIRNQRLSLKVRVVLVFLATSVIGIGTGLACFLVWATL